MGGPSQIPQHFLWAQLILGTPTRSVTLGNSFMSSYMCFSICNMREVDYQGSFQLFASIIFSSIPACLQCISTALLISYQRVCC